MAEAARTSEPARRGSAAPSAGLWRRLRQAARFARSRETASMALMGFLVRGGIVLILAPAVVLPSLINIAAVVGVRGISIEGEPTPWLLQLLSAGAALALLWLLVSAWLGAMADVWLIRLAARRERPSYPPAPTLVRLTAIRVICLLSLGPALVVAGWQVYEAAYSELVAPTQLATPFAIRVVSQAWPGILAVVLVWLVEEGVAAIAVRREVLLGRGLARSLADAFRHLWRRPLTTLATVVATYAGSIMAIGLSLAAMSVAFDWCRIAARNPNQVPVTIGLGQFATTRDFRPVIFAGAVIALALAWALALALSAVTSAWRSGAMTNEVVAGLPDGDMLEPSGPTAERSGD